MNANLKAIFNGFVEKSLLKCLVVNDNVINVYLMTSFSLSRSLFLQFLSRQFLGFTRYWLKKAKEFRELNLPGCQYDQEAHHSYIIACIYCMTLFHTQTQRHVIIMFLCHIAVGRSAVCDFLKLLEI